MRKHPLTFSTVRKIAHELPGVEDGTAYGSPALKVRGQLLACIPIHRSAEPHSLAVRVDMTDRAHLLAEAPDTYYVTDHYIPYAAVLVRLSRVNAALLRDLFAMSYKFVTAKKPTTRKRPPRRR